MSKSRDVIIAALRSQGFAGGQIPQHRAIFRLAFRKTSLFFQLALAFLATGLLFWLHPKIVLIWHALFEFWMAKLELPAEVDTAVVWLWEGVSVSFPYLNLQAANPDASLWIAGMIITGAVLAFSFLLSVEFIHIAYLLRVVSAVQMVALANFYFWPDTFPYGLPGFVLAGLEFGLLLIVIAPIVLALIYYPFGFSLWKKLWFTLICIFFLSVFVPLQYLVSAYLIYKLSLLVMPIMFFFFGLTLDIFMLIALYGWAMSWKAENLAAGE